jgi:hypothetical protein
MVHRTMLESQLAQLDEHVALGERHIARQREIIAELERGRHETKRAKELMATFLETQKMHVAIRDQLRCELAAASQSRRP